jgi:hypothetical protein
MMKRGRQKLTLDRPATYQIQVPGELDLILFVSGSNTQPILSAALMDIATLVALLWVHWRSVNLVGA